ncbi:MAG: hypothetical protein KatS3mg110_3291 [Pirellulaceae bacterium]|nr:MAG: hypothetical protein KatS3mg110_3291 [Pirellulaceae bacterium]
MHVYGPMHIHSAQPINPPHRSPAGSSAQPVALSGVDELDISAEAQQLSQSRDAAGIRADRVAAIRAQIEAGTYETPEKLEIAVSRLLDRLA